MCGRCHAPIVSGRRPGPRIPLTAIAASLACVLYWPAILLPILRTERFGQRFATSLLGGTLQLLRDGEWFVGIVVLAFSIVLPLLKILLLLELSLLGLTRQRHRAISYRAMEFAGKWGMLDVMVLAFLVMLVKLGNIVTFRFGPAVLAFVACVVLSMFASFTFDPHSLWDDEATDPGDDSPREGGT